MRADRLLTLILLLQTRGKMTAKELAEELGVSRRTILRDINALSFSGIPVYSEGGHGGGIALIEEYRTTLTGLNKSEVQTLFLSSNHHALRDLGLGDAAEHLLMKLLAALPKMHHSTADHIRQRLMIDPTWWWHDTGTPSFWEELQRAVYEDRMIETIYENYDGNITERVLAPYSLVCKSSLWYLLAEREEELRTYRVTRFHSVRVLDWSFSRRPDFDLPTYWQEHIKNFEDAFGEYRCTLRIHPQRETFVKWLMPGRWQLVNGPDEEGWITLTFMLDSDMLAKMLVFGLSRFVEVIDPPDLRDSVLAQAHEIVQYLER
ncbi:MAG TPA: WYL domain-containing protein [Anaerolineales bacterium]|nr:WYL domain-containing protein [Anaerolineales bacterium]